MTRAGLLPSGGTGTIHTTIETAPGTYTLNYTGGLFLYAGADGTTATVRRGGNLLADPGSINYIGSGNDTLVGGDKAPCI